MQDSLKKVAVTESKSTVGSGPLIPSRDWTNTDGHTITAAVKSASASNVIFLMTNGKSVDYPLAILDAAISVVTH